MHIAVVSLGAFGHVNPTLSFVTELVKRGVKAFGRIWFLNHFALDYTIHRPTKGNT